MVNLSLAIVIGFVVKFSKAILSPIVKVEVSCFSTSIVIVASKTVV